MPQKSWAAQIPASSWRQNAAWCCITNLLTQHTNIVHCIISISIPRKKRNLSAQPGRKMWSAQQHGKENQLSVVTEREMIDQDKHNYSSTLIQAERDLFWCSFTYWFNNTCIIFLGFLSPSCPVSICPLSLHSFPSLPPSDHCPAPACAYCSSHGGSPASVCPSEGYRDASLLISGVGTLACTAALRVSYLPVSAESPGETECARSSTES